MKKSRRRDLFCKKIVASPSMVIVFMGGIDMIFPFSRNVPANYKFSLFSKLPANYPKNSEKIQFTHRKIPLRGIFTYVFGIFF